MGDVAMVQSLESIEVNPFLCWGIQLGYIILESRLKSPSAVLVVVRTSKLNMLTRKELDSLFFLVYISHENNEYPGTSDQKVP